MSSRFTTSEHVADWITYAEGILSKQSLLMTDGVRKELSKGAYRKELAHLLSAGLIT